MTRTGWIAVAAGVVGAGALFLFKLGKKVAVPSYQDGATSFPFDEVTASTPPGIVEQAEVATEVAAKEAARQAQLEAEKSDLAQQTALVERELNVALAEQTPSSVAQAQALDVERQSLLSQMSANDAAMIQSMATSDVAQQSIDSAAQALSVALEREQVAANAQANAAADKVARDLEKSRQEQATAALSPSSKLAIEPAISLQVPTIKQVQNNEVKWQQALQLIQQLWMTDYPKRVTNAARLEWFVQLEKGIAETEKRFPGFNAWLVSTNKGLLSKMANEKKKVSMEVPSVDPKLVVWKTASVLTLDYWTKKYPGQTDKEKAQGLIAIVNATKATEQAAPGYMKWFEATYPGVSAKMMAEGSRLQNVSVPGSDALVTKPVVDKVPSSNQVSAQVLNAYNALKAGWVAYKKLTNDEQRKLVITATMAASVTPQGKAVWAYAQSVDPTFVAAVTAEATRLTQLSVPKSAVKIAPRIVEPKSSIVPRVDVAPRLIEFKPVEPKVGIQARTKAPEKMPARTLSTATKQENVAVVTNYVTKAKLLRDTAKVLNATNNTQSIINKKLQRVMGN